MNRNQTLGQYRRLLILLSPAILLYTLALAFKWRSLRYLRERLGFYSQPRHYDLWLHAASVGEINAALPLIHHWCELHPRSSILVTTTTPTSAKLAAGKLPAGCRHSYLPIDFSFAVKRFFAEFRPNCATVVETELWPNLFYYCDDNDIPLVIINGRISHKTLRANAWMYRLYAETLEHTTRILARTDEDKEGFVSIGAAPSKVEVVGNIKFAPSDPGTISLPLAGLNRPYILAASTHEDEELQIARAWREWGRADYLLVIIPRHPVRRNTILKQLATVNVDVATRSKNEPITASTEVYLADTIGELKNFMAGAEVVVMGGSFVKVGGHNIIEAAQLGRPLVFGPHMDNFKDEAGLLLGHDAAVQIGNIEELQSVLTRLTTGREEARGMGGRARDCVGQYADIVQKYTDRMTALCLQSGRKE